MEENENLYGFPETIWAKKGTMGPNEAAKQALYIQKASSEVMENLLSINIDNGSQRKGKRRDLAYSCWRLICCLETVLRQLKDDEMVAKQYDRLYDATECKGRWVH